MLSTLVTDACADALPWSLLGRMSPRRGVPTILRRLLQRSTQEIPAKRIENLTRFSLSPSQRRRKGERHTDHWARRNAAFCKLVARRGFGEADVVYAYNGAALEIFEAAKQHGLRTVLDQTSAPWRWNRTVLREEHLRWPGWETSPAEVDESGLLMEREESEWLLADLIITGSEFCASILGKAGGPVDRTVKLSYPLTKRQVQSRTFPTAFTETRKLRALFVGRLQLGKGIHYLHQAARALKDEPVEFRVAGPSHLTPEAQADLSRHMVLTGSVPRGEVADLYNWADVFVFPTLSEGSANVVYEAVSAGLPVITTPNAGADLVNGVSGILVEPRNHMMLAEAIRDLLRNPSLVPDLAREADRRLADLSPDSYAEQLRELVANDMPLRRKLEHFTDSSTNTLSG